LFLFIFLFAEEFNFREIIEILDNVLKVNSRTYSYSYY